MNDFNWAVYAYSYCLMNNHYPLLIEIPESNLSRGMRQLNGVYTQRLIAGMGGWGMYSGAVIRYRVEGIVPVGTGPLRCPQLGQVRSGLILGS
nr:MULTISPECIES: hypothetical protein [Nitrosospira]